MPKFVTITYDDDEVPPVLVTFPAGPPHGIEDGTTKFQLLESTKKRRKLAVKGRCVDFDGTSLVTYKSSVNVSRYNDVTTHAIGVYRPNKPIELMSVPHVYSVTQNIHSLRDDGRRGVDDDEDGDGDVVLNDATDFEKYTARNTTLVEAFGSKKRKRALKQQAANRMDFAEQDDVNVVEEHLRANAEQAGDTADIVNAATISLERSRSDTLPKYNLEATHPKNIYDIHSIISRQEWGELPYKPFAKWAKKPDSVASDGANKEPGLVRHLIVNAKEYAESAVDSDASPKLKKAARRRYVKLLAVLSLLLKFRALSPRQMKTCTSHIEMCTPVLGDMLLRVYLNKHGNESALSFDKENRARLTNDIIIVMLMATHFVIYGDTMEKLRQEFGMSLQELTRHLREVGCQSGGRGTKEWVLKAPLKLPKLRRARKRSNR